MKSVLKDNNMRLLIFGLILASLAVTAAAQKHEKATKTKPSYTAEKEARDTARPVKPPTSRNSTAQELHRVEQSSAKTAGMHHTDPLKAHHGVPVLRAEKQERNPAINAAPGGKVHAGKGKQNPNAEKGRIRHKGNHR